MCTDMHLLKHLAEHIALCIDGMFNAQRIIEETDDQERKEIFIKQLDNHADELYQTWMLLNTMFGNITYTWSKSGDVVTKYDIPQLDKASIMTCIAMQWKQHN